MVEITPAPDQNAPPRPRNTFGAPSIWTLGALLITAVVILPQLAIVWLAAFPAEPVFAHLLATSLPRYVSNSLLLMAGAGAFAAGVGTVTAWLTVMYHYPGKRWLEWALLLPLALPAYLAAFALTDFWEYAGPFQTTLRGIMGWQRPNDYWFFEVRSLGMAIFVMGLALYPYVYFLARSAFRDQSAALIEVSRSMGHGPFATFWRVGLPLARPAVMAGVALVMMEALNEFGTVEFFAVQTLTTGIFTVWLEASNVGGAAQIALMVLVFVVLLVALERTSRARARFFETARQWRRSPPRRLTGRGAAAATFVCALPVLLGFVMPLVILASHARPELWWEPDLWSAALTSVSTGLAAVAVTLIAALLLSYGVRLSTSPWPARIAPITTIGYAAPGAVLAIGILIPVAAFDNALADAVVALTGYDPGLLITGGISAIVLAYTIRFFAIGYGTLDAALGKITPNMTHAARSLGLRPGAVLRRVHMPLASRAFVTAGLLIFVDCIKELPATLLLRPFGVQTLATSAYDHASLEDIGRAAPAALLIVAVSLVPVLLAGLAQTRDRFSLS